MISRLGLGGLLLGMLYAAAVLAGALTPYDPIHQDLAFALFSPSQFHPFGCDQLGRDVMSRVVHGARISLAIGTMATLLSTLLGVTVGVIAGAGGRAGSLMMRGIDLALAFPTLVLLLVLASLWPTDNWLALIGLLALTTWMPTARLVRAETLALSRRPFMEAAQSAGAPPLRRLVRHVIPNVASTVLVAATLQVGDMMLLESGLSYLGLGVTPPTPSWGDMVRQGMQHLGDAWWLTVFPGLALALAVIGFNLLGDGLRDLLEPRLAFSFPGRLWRSSTSSES